MFVPLETPVSEAELQQIDFYKRRVAELQRNLEELEGNGFFVSTLLGVGEDRRISTPKLPVSIHRLKGVYIDFRFLWAENEASQFLEVRNIVGKHCNTTESVRKALKEMKEQWKNASVGKRWHGLEADEMISAIFYGAVIHEANDKQQSLERVNSLLSESAAHHILLSVIWARTFPLKSLVWMLEPLSAKSQVVQIPDVFA